MLATNSIYKGDCLEVMKEIDDNSIDSVVTDPPYGISFMGKKWDYNIPTVEVWKECLRVLKPGGHILVACGTRTQHRMAVNIEDAGFEIRDIVSWIYGSGFPKSLNIGKAIDKIQGNEREVIGTKTCGYQVSISKTRLEQGHRPNLTKSTSEVIVDKGNSPYEGWGTALKPAMELWTLARKPLSEKTIASNVLKWGTGGINIDGCRVEHNDNPLEMNSAKNKAGYKDGSGGSFGNQYRITALSQGRFPANLIHDGSDEVVGEFPDSIARPVKPENIGKSGGHGDSIFIPDAKVTSGYYDTEKSASRFFYCAKSSKKERNKGLDNYLTVKYNISNKNKKKGILCEENTVAVQLLQRVISGQGLVNFSTGECGENIMVQCPKDSLSITLTEINKIIESKILNLLLHSLTSESILDANSEMVSGGSPVKNVENLKKFLLTTTKGNLELVRGASNVALQTLSLISVRENWKEATNFHSTVKPIALMKYLCRLITPPDGIVLDPYMGSGSTCMACKIEGFNWIGLEKEEEYCKIAFNRIKEVGESL